MGVWQWIKNFFTGGDEKKLIEMIHEKILRHADRYRNSGDSSSAGRCDYYAERVLHAQNLSEARAIEKEFWLFMKSIEKETGEKHHDETDHEENDETYETDDSGDDDDDSEDDDFSDNS